MVVGISFDISLSEGLYDLVSPTSRLWNIYARAAMREELIKHHDKRIPKHFVMGAHDQYGYATRKETTKRKKKGYWKVPGDLDLIRSGRTRRSVKEHYDITMRGAFGGSGNPGALTGRLNMWLPYPLQRSKRPDGITPEEIEDEIVRVTPGEAREIAEGYLDKLVMNLQASKGPLRKFLKKSATYSGRRLGPGF